MIQKAPPFRKLRGYAFDPSLSQKIDTAFINLLTYKIPWEENLKEGPIGEYVEVIDYDPTTQTWYIPVDLNNNYILAQDGLFPSESNPQYHQQMCYAVAMTTIMNFEKALGRPIMWSPHQIFQNKNSQTSSDPEYVKTLRIYPHAIRDANAFYSPQKKALLFGYFSTKSNNTNDLLPNALVFTCLSHDIIAHETTHAILDGIHSKYSEDTNPDVLAFHEAIADIVALFQHFTFPEVLTHQIAKTRGDLSTQNLLGELAQQFGSAVGNYGALRDAIGVTDKDTKIWHAKVPNGLEYQNEKEPHNRGAILVSAVFDTFLTIYRNRTADLLRIATGGSGILPEGYLHPDLVNRLAKEASKSAQHVLNMCIRALDYCPPVDITFGDYLRGIITADIDLEEEDSCEYRLAFIDSFRKRGIYPEGIKSLSEDSLKYSAPVAQNIGSSVSVLSDFLRKFSNEMAFTFDRKIIFDITKKYIKGDIQGNNENDFFALHSRIAGKFSTREFEKLTGLVFSETYKEFGVNPSPSYGTAFPSFYIRSLKLASRVGPKGNKTNQIIITLSQNAHFVVVKEDSGKVHFQPRGSSLNEEPENHPLTLMGGVTLIFDLDKMSLKYCISKPILDQDSLPAGMKINEKRILALYNYLTGYKANSSSFAAYFVPEQGTTLLEPFSMLHRL